MAVARIEISAPSSTMTSVEMSIVVLSTLSCKYTSNILFIVWTTIHERNPLGFEPVKVTSAGPLDLALWCLIAFETVSRQ